MIDETRLIDYAVKFKFGHCEIDTLTGKPPVYLELASEGWVIRAEYPGSANPHYLNQREPRWRYKRGTAFESIKQAVECFNDWMSARLIAGVDVSPEPPIISPSDSQHTS